MKFPVQFQVGGSRFWNLGPLGQFHRALTTSQHQSASSSKSSSISISISIQYQSTFVIDFATIYTGINAPNFWGAWGGYREILRSVRRLCEKVVRGRLQELLSELTRHFTSKISFFLLFCTKNCLHTFALITANAGAKFLHRGLISQLAVSVFLIVCANQSLISSTLGEDPNGHTWFSN